MLEEAARSERVSEKNVQTHVLGQSRSCRDRQDPS